MHWDTDMLLSAVVCFVLVSDLHVLTANATGELFLFPLFC